MSLNTRPRVAVAGASGFVGSELTLKLLPRFDVVALSRSKKRASPDPRLEYRGCDLFSLLDAENALKDVQYAYYLVHSMSPSARLTQGSFRDLDLIAADNFARAAARAGVRQIIYLGGLIPTQGKLSEHLQSRLEVERALSSHGVPVTALRAGLILGADGSSFQIVAHLARRLPFMICPKWTNTPTQPIALDDVVNLLDYCLDRPETYGQVYDVGGPDVTTYRELITVTSEALGVKRPMLSFPLFTPTLSRLWVRLVTGAPKALVYPLIESLKHPMVARDRRLQDVAKLPGLGMRAAIELAIKRQKEHSAKQPTAYQRPGNSDSDVRSVQRLTLPTGKNAEWAAHEYLAWLPRIFFPVRVRVDGDKCAFRLFPFGPDLLVLEFSKSRSSPARALFYIRGGWLASIQGRGRLEFRECFDHAFLLVAVHEFRPTLPWALYSITQAKAHALVMWAFGRHLRRLNRKWQRKTAAAVSLVFVILLCPVFMTIARRGVLGANFVRAAPTSPRTNFPSPKKVCW